MDSSRQKLEDDNTPLGGPASNINPPESNDEGGETPEFEEEEGSQADPDHLEDEVISTSKTRRPLIKVNHVEDEQIPI